MLPKFQRLLISLQSPDRPPTPAQLADAARTRKRLVDAFGHYNVAARRLRDLPTTSPTQTKLQQAIYQQSYNFLQIHMLPLKSLPKILKHATSAPALTPNGKPQSALASIKYNNNLPNGNSSNDNLSISNVSSSAIEELEAEERTLRESLIVLEEQLFLVKQGMDDATKRRQFNEVEALKRNYEDLQVEVDRVQGQIQGLDFEGVYVNGSAGPASPAMKGKG